MNDVFCLCLQLFVFFDKRPDGSFDESLQQRFVADLRARRRGRQSRHASDRRVENRNVQKCNDAQRLRRSSSSVMFHRV